MKTLVLSMAFISSFAFANDHMHHMNHEDHSKTEVKKSSSDSLYNFKSQLLDQNEKKVMLQDFEGKWVLITMAYTSCQYSCPLIVSKLKDIEKTLKKEGLKDVQILLVSFDTKRDNPKKFRDYIKEKKIEMRQKSTLNLQLIEAFLKLSIV
jgi:protein SCO1/2